MKCRLSAFFLLICIRSLSQTQTCPVNIDFSTGDLTHWYAYTGNNFNGNGTGAIKQTYDSNAQGSFGTIGTVNIQEFSFPSVIGISIIHVPYSDEFGGFLTIPTINGYHYRSSVKLGSTAIRRGNLPSSGGGYIRGVSYRVKVPPGSVDDPYTMTYAYAMVLENGTHPSLNQPLISVTLKTSAGIITCASPSYYLPTYGAVGFDGRGATLDSATAKKNGFKVSPTYSPNFSPDPNGGGSYLQDIWTKNWTEVTYDLAPFRGQEVSLIIEADNCVPGGHFAYGYVAFRNDCGGLEISGDSAVCNNSVVTYSVPALAGATYKWNIPDSWKVLSGDTSNILVVKSSSLNGKISVNEKNSCTNLSDERIIETFPSPEAGNINGAGPVCTGENNTILKLSDFSGTISNWIYSTDSLNWTTVPSMDSLIIARNLATTTIYKAVVTKGSVCPADTSEAGTIVVDSKSIAGTIDPPLSTFCIGQPFGVTMNLSQNVGMVQKWQASTDGFTWTDVDPFADSSLTVQSISTKTEYRLITKNGVCPSDTSAPASIDFTSNPFPQATLEPENSIICYGSSAFLKADVSTGTSLTWFPSFETNTQFTSPYEVTKEVIPKTTTDYVLRVFNEGCPNPLTDTFHVAVRDPVVVDAGRDTSIVVGQPLQFHAMSSDEGPDSFVWTPAIDLNNPDISDPIGYYTMEDGSVKYNVKATTPFGCVGDASITVKVFKTKPDIFVPNAFTPGKSSNSIFRPIPVGISTLQYFRVYNRQGEMVYHTSTMGIGWDGTVNGQPQGSGGFVWMVRGIDYNGNVIVKDGTMVLIR